MDFKKLQSNIEFVLSLIVIDIILTLVLIAVLTVVQMERYQPDIDIICPMGSEVNTMFEEINDKLNMCEEFPE